MRRGDMVRWLGFAGSLLLTVVTAAGPAGLPRWLAAVPAVVLAAAVAGMGIVVLAWALLGRLVVSGAESAPGPRSLKLTLLLWAAPLLFARPLFSGDVHSYRAQGEIAARGLDPYTVGPNEGLGATSALTQDVSGYWRDAPSPYGPLFTLLQRVIAQVTGENQVAGVLAYRLVAVAGVALIVWAVPRLAARAGVPAGVALWLGALNPLLLWHFVAGVHNDALMAGLMVAGTALALAAIGETISWGRLSAGIVVISLGADVKLPAVVALAVVGTVLARRFGGRLWHLVVAGAAMIASVALVSAAVSLVSGVGFGWLGTLDTSGQLNSWMAPTNWAGFVAGQTVIQVGRMAGYVLIVCGVGVVVYRQLRGRIAELPALGALLAVVVVFGPVVQPWYLLWAVIPLAVCLPAGRVRTVVATLSAVFAVVLPPLGGNFSGKVGELVLGYAGAIVVLALVAFLTRESRPKVTS
ncbi:polyprenol phosphomannose-dependent alpha 1,6 mannosyltransferase MptB [Amycolatopsis suaedae]|uniref:DUF2029 domain-containing protein n=1 Tax=Amycolatopsis suaedae TaxID=2510978 RepID=A0A4Q7JD93_9PSEU|nr:polyprenol phosphomannose-dependent alpha 1,6 mannosyltransferase MptB [Amycolatopsis suaedae]RZQ65861.1 hypothetical protein EWH70_01940 [Amycolatopsis suaedae]